MSVLRSRQVKKAFEGIFLHGGFAAVQENTTLFPSRLPGASLTPEFSNTLPQINFAKRDKWCYNVNLP